MVQGFAPAQVAIMDASTRELTMLTDGKHNDGFPSWAPDCERILGRVWIRCCWDYELYTIDPDTKRVTRLTRPRGTDAHGSWSPDGEWISFSSVRGGYKDEAAVNPGHPQASGDIYVMRHDGSDVHALTDNPFEEGSPSGAP